MRVAAAGDTCAMRDAAETATRLATVQRGFDAFARRDFEFMRTICHSWLDFRDELGPLMGVDSVRAYMQDWFSHLRDFRAELGDASEDRDVMIADVLQTARLKDSDVEVDAHFTHVFAWQEGLIGTWHIYADRGEAEAFAGRLRRERP